MKQGRERKLKNFYKSKFVLLSIGSFVCATSSFFCNQLNQKSVVFNNSISRASNLNITFNTKIDLSSIQISGFDNFDIKNKTNNVWVNEMGIGDGSHFTYGNSLSGNKRIIWNILLSATNLPTNISEENIEFKILRNSIGIDGSVFWAVNLIVHINNGTESEQEIPSLESGTIKNAIIELTGFKMHETTDDGYDNYSVSHSTQVNYQNIFSTLPSNFNDLSLEAKILALTNFVKSNWIYFLKFNELGFVATKANNSSTLLDDFLGDINISGAFSLIDNTLTFSFTYIQSRNAVEKNPGLAKNVNVSNISLPERKKSSLGLSQIVGIALCLGGGTLLLIAMIILLVKKSSLKDEDSQFSTVEYIPNEHTGYIGGEAYNQSNVLNIEQPSTEQFYLSVNQNPIDENTPTESFEAQYTNEYETNNEE